MTGGMRSTDGAGFFANEEHPGPYGAPGQDAGVPYGYGTPAGPTPGGWVPEEPYPAALDEPYPAASYATAGYPEGHPDGAAPFVPRQYDATTPAQATAQAGGSVAETKDTADPEEPPAGRRHGTALLVLRVLVFGAAALALLAAGAWSGFTDTRDAVSSDRARGTVRVTHCGSTLCTGPFTPSSGASAQRAPRVSLPRYAVGSEHERLQVARVPNSDEAVRTGPSGLVQAWMLFGGALLLCAVLLFSGLGLRRTSVLLAILGALVVVATFATR